MLFGFGLGSVDDPHYEIWLIHFVRFNGVAAFSVVAYDTLSTCFDEIQYIWTQPLKSPTKWVYLMTRYFSLLMQIQITVMTLTLTPELYDVATCRKLFYLRALSGGLLMHCIQCQLMLRAYALFIHARRIAVAFIAFFVAEVAAGPTLIHFADEVSLAQTGSNGMLCIRKIRILDLWLFGVSCTGPHLIIIGVTIFKFLKELPAGWGRIPIVLRVVKDDVSLVLLIISLVTSISIAARFNSMYAYVGFNWLIALVPSMSCRNILSMQKLRLSGCLRGHPNQACSCQPSRAPQLTSFVFESLSTSQSVVVDRLSVLDEFSKSRPKGKKVWA
ncbi:hypothetical protein CPB83DRAFT_886285 [Crepidotus variabilis]|uniref:DUF6533 domain-containing protein n=1 Tax=Crepidotus variabilis TaxID=179855 RepID=A0A9P6E8B9_9AGAR|nr:hypothetical protein CPB83DRAFT_886285 [Crepidotus variabilis]